MAEDVYYTKDHDWIKIIDGYAYMGKAKQGLKDIGCMALTELPSVGTEVVSGDEIAFLEGAKGVSIIHSPFCGSIAKINEELLDRPEILNDNCEDTFIVAIYNKEGYDVKNLLNYGGYMEYLMGF